MESMKPQKENFSIKQVDLNGVGGLKVKYEIYEQLGEEEYRYIYQVENQKIIHSDLYSPFYRLKYKVGGIFNMITVAGFIEESDADADIKEATSDLSYSILDRIKISGISIVREGSKRFLIIKSVFMAENGYKTVLKTPKIKLDITEDSEICEIVSIIKEEVYEYLFNNKQAQLEVLDGFSA